MNPVEADRLGHLGNDFGERLILTEVRPGLLKVLLRHAVLRSLERVAAQKSVLEVPRLCYDVLKRELHSSK
eukprot:864199-Pyramimonas_sp.AAC.1